MTPAAPDTPLWPALAPLAPLFAGPLAPWRDALMGHDDPRPAVPLMELLSRDRFDACLATYARAYASDASEALDIEDVGDAADAADATDAAGDTLDRRALASEWSKRYFSRLLPPVLAGVLLLDLALPLALDDMSLLINDRGEPLAFKLPCAASCPRAAQAGARLAPLVDGHLAPLIDALARHTRLSPRVFWSNAGNLIEWMLTAVAAFPAAALPVAPRAGVTARLEDARAMLKARHRTDGRPNPLYLPVRYLDAHSGAAARPTVLDASPEPPWRQRRVCCVRYLLPGTELCANCPLLGRSPEANQLT